MPVDRNKLFQKLYSSFKNLEGKAVAEDVLQEKCSASWRELKHRSSTDDELETLTLNLIAENQQKLRNKGISKFFFPSSSSSNVKSPSPAAASLQLGESGQLSSSSASPASPAMQMQTESESGDSDIDDPTFEGTQRTAERPKPAQAECKKKIGVLQAQLNALLTTRRSGMAGPNIERDIKWVKKKLETEETRLSTYKGQAKRARKARLKKKMLLEAVFAENPEVAKKLRAHAVPGRPSLCSQQPALLQTIVEIAMLASGAEKRRRDERLEACQTLDELTEQLKHRGFEISRSGVYLHLMPRDPKSLEGRRHVETAPVRLVRPQNSHHKDHIDGKFATASIRYLESLASYLGPQQVLFLSVDNKATVPIGKTAAKEQAPMLMSMGYRVILPDHDFPVGPRHSLVPSVNAVVVIKEDGLGTPEAVSYSGPTYVCVRSGKHSSSTANTHADDLGRMLEKPQFLQICKTPNGLVKPVLIETVDGGPDECPRFRKNIMFAIKHFLDYDLDAIFIATNAPGRSAFNRVERRMAPLSHRMSGLILPHDHYGSHLDSQGRTIDEELERKNFEKAGHTLEEVWSGMTIDGHPVLSEYIPPGESELPPPVDQQWYATHVRESQYLLQVVRCSSEECCGPPRSSLHYLLNGFLPPPVRVKQTPAGVAVVDPDEEGGHYMPLFQRLASNTDVPRQGFKRVPYDLFCPSVRSKLAGRVCRICGIYFANVENKATHNRKVHKNTAATTSRVRASAVVARRGSEVLCRMLYDHGAIDLEWQEEEEVDILGLEPEPVPDATNTAPIIESLSDFLSSPWESA